MKWEGHMVVQKYFLQILIYEVEVDYDMVKFFEIRKNESRLIYDSIEGLKKVIGKDNNNGTAWKNIPHELDEVSYMVCII